MAEIGVEKPLVKEHSHGKPPFFHTFFGLIPQTKSRLVHPSDKLFKPDVCHEPQTSDRTLTRWEDAPSSEDTDFPRCRLTPREVAGCLHDPDLGTRLAAIQAGGPLIIMI